MIFEKVFRVSALSIFMVCFLLTVFFVTCSKSSLKSGMVITEKHNGKTVDIKEGETFTIRLEAQLSTGFGWKIVEHGSNVEIAGKPVEETQKKQIVGGIDYQIFNFKAVKKGSESVILHYVQPFAKEPKPSKTCAVKINVIL